MLMSILFVNTLHEHLANSADTHLTGLMRDY
jgi:hypothetical protein